MTKRQNEKSQKDRKTKREKERKKDKKDQRQKTKTKKRVLYCEIRAVLHSCDVFCELHNVNRLCDDSPDSPYTGEQYFVRMCDASSVWHNVWCALKSAVTN